MAGYRLACKEAVKYIQEHLTYSVESFGDECLINAAKTAMSSKLIGSDSEFFSKMVVDAANAIKMSDGKGGYTYPIKAINVLKAHGKSARESLLIKGYALNCTIAAQQMPRSIANAKIACLDFSLQKVKMKMGVQLLVSDPDQIEAIRQREYDISKEKIQHILNSGANVILTTGGIDDLCLKYFVEAGAMAVRRVKKPDLRRIAKATGATFCTQLTNMEGEDVFEPSYLGTADEVAQERICDETHSHQRPQRSIGGVHYSPRCERFHGWRNGKIDPRRALRCEADVGVEDAGAWRWRLRSGSLHLSRNVRHFFGIA